MADLKIVIVGAGFAGRVVHLPGYSAVGAPVAAICDLMTDRAQQLADQFNIPRVYSDWREMIDKEQPDIVSVCLPNSAHRGVTLAALEAGAHVLCEKPLATNVAEAHEMFDAARKAGKILMAAQHLRFEAGARTIKRIIDGGALGEIYHTEASVLRRLGIPTWGSFHQKSSSVGGALLDIGVHILDQAMWLIGNPRPVRVSAITQQKFGRRKDIAAIFRNAWNPDTFDVEDFGAAFVRFDNGSTMILRASWAAHVQEPERYNCMILGTEAGATTRPPALFHLRNGTLADEEYKNVRAANTYEVQARYFLAAVRGEREPAVQEAETINVQRILNAAYRSSEEGREVEVDD